MFTGLVETTGKAVRVENRGSGIRLGIEVAEEFLDGVEIGDSISVSGVCLTVVEIGGKILEFDVVPETVSRSTLKNLSTGGKVNCERSLRVGDRLGGHFVTGHIDAACRILSRRHDGGEERFEVELPGGFAGLVIPKGSIALDGVSLTIASLKKNSFEVALIPHTLERTTLGGRRVGDYLNVEFDAIAKMVARHLELRGKDSSGITMDDLNRHGFI